MRRNNPVVTLNDEIVAARCRLVDIDGRPIRLAERFARLRGGDALVGESSLCESLGTMSGCLSRGADGRVSCVFCGT
jgi:hypothetical protein